DPDPEGLEAPALPLAARADALDIERALGQREGLRFARPPIIATEGEVKQRNIDTEEGRHRPGAGGDEADPGAKADPRKPGHEPGEAARRQAAVGGQGGVEEDALGRGVAHKTESLEPAAPGGKALSGVSVTAIRRRPVAAIACPDRARARSGQS